MGKTRELSQIQRNEIVIKYHAGISVQSLSIFYKVPRQTIYYQINKHKLRNSTDNLVRKGRPRKTTPRQDRLILQKFKEDVLITPKTASMEVKKDYGISISRKTVERRLKEANFATYVARPIPFISPKNKLKRLAFAKSFVNKPQSFWEQILWTDESSFEYHGSKNKIYCRLPKNIRKKVRPAIQRIPHGGGSVMFWGCVCFNGIGDLVPINGTMNQGHYLRILNDHALLAGDRLIGQDFILQQDNAPCHKAKMINKFLRDLEVKSLDWPPQSPDLNIIENVWAYVKRKRSPNLTRTREETIAEVEGLWKEISLETLQNLVKSVPARLQKVIDAKGGFIFY